MYNNNNGKYPIHYGRKGMKWGMHIYTKDDDFADKLFRRKRSKKANDMARSGKYTIMVNRDGSRFMNFKNRVKDSKGRVLEIYNSINKVDDLSDAELDDAVRLLEDSRGIESRMSKFVRGLNDSYNRNDLTYDPYNIVQSYHTGDKGPMITINTGRIDDQGHFASGTYYVNTDEFGKNDFVIDG